MQSVQELFFGDSSIRTTVYSNDLVKCTSRKKLGIYDDRSYDTMLHR